MTTNAPVTESELDEIEAVMVGDDFEAKYLAANVDNVVALCASLRAERARISALLEAHQIDRHELRRENTALREQLAENARWHFDDARSLERQRNEALDQCAELHQRLAQVEEELTKAKRHRDDLIEELREQP